jgi:hypothetical protein
MNKAKSLSFIHELICDEVMVSPQMASIIEQIMRDDIFHSTLDWQTAEELKDGARKAHELYKLAPNHFDTAAAQQAATYETMRASANARRTDEPEIIAKAE